MEKLANMIFTAGTLMVGSSFVFSTFTYTVDAGQRALIFDRFRGLKE
jgi:hypothetical protein